MTPLDLSEIGRAFLALTNDNNEGLEVMRIPVRKGVALAFQADYAGNGPWVPLAYFRNDEAAKAFVAFFKKRRKEVEA